MDKRNPGILASISWNSNLWAGPATKDDIGHSNYQWVKENHRMVEDLNFGHLLYPPEPDGTFIAYTPMFNRLPSPSESRYVEIVFFRSLDYHTNQNLIVGFYAFPQIGHYFRKAEHELFQNYPEGGNVKARKENILLLKNPVEISDSIARFKNFLPAGKKLGQQGFNYLGCDNVLRILDEASLINPGDENLKRIKLKILTEFKGFR